MRKKSKTNQIFEVATMLLIFATTFLWLFI